MSEFVRVRLDEVGEWSHPIGHPLPEGAEVLDEPAVDGTGQVIASRPFPAEAAPVERKPFYASDMAADPDVPAGDSTATGPDNRPTGEPAAETPVPTVAATPAAAEPVNDPPAPPIDPAPAAKNKIKEN